MRARPQPHCNPPPAFSRAAETGADWQPPAQCPYHRSALRGERRVAWRPRLPARSRRAPRSTTVYAGSSLRRQTEWHQASASSTPAIRWPSHASYCAGYLEVPLALRHVYLHRQWPHFEQRQCALPGMLIIRACIEVDDRSWTASSDALERIALHALQGSGRRSLGKHARPRPHARSRWLSMHGFRHSG